MNIENEIKKAVYFQKTGELEKARVIYEKILEINPGHSECTSLLNLISIQEYKERKVRNLIVRSSQDTYKTASYCNNLGVSFYKKGELDKAIFYYKKALEENPKNANALNNIGLVYRDQGNPHDAILCYKKAIEIDKGFSNAYNNMGVALDDQGKLDAAILCYKKALEENPKNANALHNIGSVYRKQGNTHEATLCYRNALEIEPDHMKALHNLGGILEEGGKLDEAEACYRRLLKIIPDHAEGKQNLGIILLLKGELEEGFELYEARWQASKLEPRFSGTRWEGQALKSKIILLCAEQGIGDTIQFVRYAPLVKAMGCKVIFAVQPTLTGVLSNIEGIDQVIRTTLMRHPMTIIQRS